MLRRACALVSIAIALSLLAATGAAATAQRTFVASNGNDANPCSLVMPCRTFGAAIVQTLSGGEVVVLNSAGYGPVTITKSVTIAAPAGVYAGISVFSGYGIWVHTGSSDVVALRNLTIIGMGGTYGIYATNSTGDLRIDGIRASGFTALNGAGLAVEAPEIEAMAHLTVTNSVFEGNYFGIRIAPYLGGVKAAIRSTQLTRNVVGYFQFFNGEVTISDTTASGNSGIGPNEGIGFYFVGAGGRLVLESCVASENSEAGVWLPGGAEGLVTAVVVLSANSITGNGVGVAVGDGTVYTRGNNTIAQNGSDVTGTLTPIPGGGT